MSKKKKNVTTLINAHPYTPEGIARPLQPRRLKAQRSSGGFALKSGALELGLVPGDLVTGTQGINGMRYITGTTLLRRGTLTSLPVGQYFCQCHGPEVIDQVTRDWRSNGAVFVEERGGVVRGFWPERIPPADAAVSVDRSAIEYDLPSTVIRDELRGVLIEQATDLSPFSGRNNAA